MGQHIHKTGNRQTGNKLQTANHIAHKGPSKLNSENDNSAVRKWAEVIDRPTCRDGEQTYAKTLGITTQAKPQ
jgi:hypothetical protein